MLKNKIGLILLGLAVAGSPATSQLNQNIPLLNKLDILDTYEQEDKRTLSFDLDFIGFNWTTGNQFERSKHDVSLNDVISLTSHNATVNRTFDIEYILNNFDEVTSTLIIPLGQALHNQIQIQFQGRISSFTANNVNNYLLISNIIVNENLEIEYPDIDDGAEEGEAEYPGTDTEDEIDVDVEYPGTETEDNEQDLETENPDIDKDDEDNNVDGELDTDYPVVDPEDNEQDLDTDYPGTDTEESDEEDYPGIDEDDLDINYPDNNDNRNIGQRIIDVIGYVISILLGLTVIYLIVLFNFFKTKKARIKKRKMRNKKK